jgi:CheY-like chemotaxis protein
MAAEHLSTTEARRCACILVVDDEPLVAAAIADILGQEGYEVEMAKNGREALKKIAARSYDLILCDLLMPELDGVGLYREIERQQPSLLQRLAFVSGSTEVPKYASFCERTAVALLSKPFALADLLRLVHRLLHDTR